MTKTQKRRDGWTPRGARNHMDAIMPKAKPNDAQSKNHTKRVRAEFLKSNAKTSAPYRSRALALVLTEARLSLGARALFALRMMYADHKTGEHSMPSKETLSALLGVSVRAVVNWDVELVIAGLASVKRRQRPLAAAYTLISSERINRAVQQSVSTSSETHTGALLENAKDNSEHSSETHDGALLEDLPDATIRFSETHDGAFIPYAGSKKTVKEKLHFAAQSVKKKDRQSPEIVIPWNAGNLLAIYVNLNSGTVAPSLGCNTIWRQ